MEFKDRFKGRTTTVTKEGMLDTLSAPSKNPVQKSQSNTHFNATKISNPLPQNEPSSHNITHQKLPVDRSLENRPSIPMHIPPQSYSKSPVGQSHHVQPINQPRLSNGAVSKTPNKNPYLVSNPFTSFDPMEKQSTSFEYGGGQYSRMEPHQISNQPKMIYQSLPNDQFNPNSFYNQHSNFKSNLIDQPPIKTERQASYGGFNPQQILKKKFENLSQQNKQMRLAEEAGRGFDSPNFNQRPPLNNRYGEFNQPPPIFYNHDYSQNPQQGPQFNGYREIHSNPAPRQMQQNEAFGYYTGNMQNQFAGRQPLPVPYEGSPSRGPVHGAAQQESKSVSQSKTNFKPYNLKDYKEVKANVPVKMGGLGANTNTEDWYKEKEKRDKMTEFSQNVKLFNMQRLPNTETSFKPRNKEKEKEKSRREIALEFAKNIPKPKQRKNSPIEEDMMEELHTKKSESDMLVDYGGRAAGGSDDLDLFEQRHNFYAAQLQRMKNS